MQRVGARRAAKLIGESSITRGVGFRNRAREVRGIVRSKLLSLGFRGYCPFNRGIRSRGMRRTGQRPEEVEDRARIRLGGKRRGFLLPRGSFGLRNDRPSPVRGCFVSLLTTGRRRACTEEVEGMPPLRHRLFRLRTPPGFGGSVQLPKRY